MPPVFHVVPVAVSIDAYNTPILSLDLDTQELPHRFKGVLGLLKCACDAVVVKSIQ